MSEPDVPSASATKGDHHELPVQTVGLLRAARHLYAELPADALVLITETALDWDAVQAHLSGCRLLVAAQNPSLVQRLKAHDQITLLQLETEPKPIRGSDQSCSPKPSPAISWFREHISFCSTTVSQPTRAGRNRLIA